MITTLDRLAWIAAALVLALAVAAQELRQTDKLTITRANILTASKTQVTVASNKATVGRAQRQVIVTNATTITRNFPMMTDILQKSQSTRQAVQRLQTKEQK